ncbi:MAG TPA: hypothetical protein VFC92_09140 [Bacteroidales bacterium]|nr:hypothetical protein [Bacteroidales bacterium]
MTKFFKPTLLMMFAATAMLWLQSCESDLLDISETFTFENEFTIYTTDTLSTIVEAVDMAEKSSIINDYGNKIKSIEITDVTYWLTMHQGAEDQKIIEAHLQVSDLTDQGMATIANLADVNLSQLVNNPQSLAVQQGGLDRMEELIKNNPHSFKLTYTNACNTAPLDFTIKFRYTIKMTANPLN